MGEPAFKPIVIKDVCERQADHTPTPSGYIAFHAWAQEMSESHTQVQCEDCGLWAVWVPNGDRSPAAAKARATRLLKKWARPMCMHIPKLPRR